MYFTLPPHRPRALLLGTSAILLVSLTSAPSRAQDVDTLLLDMIVVDTGAANAETEISSEDPADTGTTVLGETSVSTRTDTSGDINSVLRTVPTVQYANDSDTDAGVNETDELTLLPLEVSIAGARVTENNFMLNGIGINSIIGSDAFFGSSTNELSRDTGVLTIQSHYGLSSQSQYVPSSLVESVEVMDSNVSAEYGGFLGGAVDAKLREPSTEKNFGSFELSYSGSSLTEYKLGTEDGENPDEVEKPEFDKYSITLEQNWAINDQSAAIFGISRRAASASKDHDPQYVEGKVEDETTSDFYRLGLSHSLLNGEKLSFEIDYTDYNQEYWVDNAVNHGVTIENSGLIVNGKYEKEWDELGLLGLATRNTKLEFNATYQHNKSSNDQPSDEYYVWYASYDTYDYVTDQFSDWCVADDERTSCLAGGYGDKAFEDEQFEANVKLSGDIWNGSFNLGATLRHSIANRSGTGFDWYTSSEYNTEHDIDSFTCAADDTACTETQYLKYWYHQDAYDVTVDATKVESYLELDQSFGDFRVRGGLRLDYNDYLKNVDISPRLALSWKPNDRFSATFGANRYYDDNYLAYAIMDNLPRYDWYTRSHDADGVVEEFTYNRTFSSYNYGQGNLDTPYKDELTLGLNYRDTLTEGHWRLKAIHREGHDEFARSEDSTTFDNILTNDGSSTYDSITLEYANSWDMAHLPRVDKLGVYFSAVWADRWVSNNTYYGSDGDTGESTEFIYYNGTSYTENEFQEVTGNLDIPVRATVEVNGSLMNEKLHLGLGADIAFSYWGVKYTDEDGDYTNATYGEQEHMIYEDYRYGASVMGYLTAEAQIAEVKGNPLTVKLKLDNIFGNVGNATADDDNPWVRARSASLTMGYSW